MHHKRRVVRWGTFHKREAPAKKSPKKGIHYWAIRAQIAAHLVTIIAGSAAATTYIATKVIQHESAASEALAGTWTNFPEGCIDCRYSDLPPFSLKLDYQAGIYAGTIDVSSYVTNENAADDIMRALGVSPVMFWKMQACCISLQGHRFLNEVDLEIYDYILGKRTVLGHAVLKRRGDYYQWVLQNIDKHYAKFFPRRAWITNFDADYIPANEADTSEMSSSE